MPIHPPDASLRGGGLLGKKDKNKSNLLVNFHVRSTQISFHNDLTLSAEIHGGNRDSEYKIRQPSPGLSDTKPSNPLFG
jgi:hypothetical protein